jgi:hypothetical protein
MNHDTIQHIMYFMKLKDINTILQLNHHFNETNHLGNLLPKTQYHIYKIKYKQRLYKSYYYPF